MLTNRPVEALPAGHIFDVTAFVRGMNSLGAAQRLVGGSNIEVTNAVAAGRLVEERAYRLVIIYQLSAPPHFAGVAFLDVSEELMETVLAEGRRVAELPDPDPDPARLVLEG